MSDKLYTVTEAAAQLGRNKDVVRRVAERNGIGVVIGERRNRVLTASDIAAIRKVIRDSPGQPAKNQPEKAISRRKPSARKG